MENSDTHLYIILDGMAQRKTYIPYYRRSCWDTAIISRKDKVPSMQLPVRVIGTSLYGFRNEKIAFLITEYTKEVGSHPTAFIRRRIQISWLCTEFSSTLDPPFRSTFIFKWSDRFSFIDVYRTVQANSNNTMSAFLASLVQRGIVATIQVSYLVVGHTHDLLDAWFGTISVAVRSFNFLLNLVDQAGLSEPWRSSRTGLGIPEKRKTCVPLALMTLA